MIQPPRRSVTRFFIPLIDVLTLLFCVFLVMPAAQPNEDGGSAPPPATVEELLKQRREDRIRLKHREEEVEKARQEKGRPLEDRVLTRVLEIDDRTGKLYYRGENGQRVEIPDEAAALGLIASDRKRLARSQREMLYIILYPRDRRSDKPTDEQEERYRTWFRSAQVRFDIPGRSP
jgi:hypothetical protein